MWVFSVASFDWSECVSFDGLATCPECIGVCVPVHVYVRLSVCMNVCVCVYVCTFSGLRQSYAAASWLSLKLSGLAYLPCQLHSLWQPDDMGLCDGHDPPDVPPAPTPHPPSRPPSSQSDWASGLRHGLTLGKFWGFFLRLRARWLSTKVVLEGTVLSSGYGNNYLLNMNKTVIVKHDPLPEEYSTIFWFFSWIRMTNGPVRRCLKNLLKVMWFWLK